MKTELVLPDNILKGLHSDCNKYVLECWKQYKISRVLFIQIKLWQAFPEISIYSTAFTSNTTLVVRGVMCGLIPTFIKKSPL